MPTAAAWALAVAIGCEVVGTIALKMSDGFARPLPAMVTVVSYGAAFYAMSIALRTLPVGVVYAIWSGVGIVLISLIGFMVFDQALDVAALIGLALIVAGVVVINGFSSSVHP